MIATKALHQLGDISRDEPDLCWVDETDGDDYIGNWITGYGFINVRFPKATTRPLTQQEIDKYDGTYVQIGSQPPVKLNIKENA